MRGAPRSGARRLCDLRGPHALGDLLPSLPLDQGDVVLALEVEPELAAVAEIATEAHRRVGRDRAAPVEDVGDVPRGDAEVEREAVRAQGPRLDFAPQQPARMGDWRHAVSFA